MHCIRDFRILMRLCEIQGRFLFEVYLNLYEYRAYMKMCFKKKMCALDKFPINSLQSFLNVQRSRFISQRQSARAPSLLSISPRSYTPIDGNLERTR